MYIDFRRPALDTTILPREPHADNGSDGGNGCGGGSGYLWSPLVIGVTARMFRLCFRSYNNNNNSLAVKTPFSDKLQLF